MQPDCSNITVNSSEFHVLANSDVTSVLDDRALLEITGPDSAKFLQGQLTCNLQDISTLQSRPGAHCSHQGRMVASFRLTQVSAQTYVFILPADTLPSLQASLKKYIVFSKATLRDATAEYRVLGVSGPNATQRVSSIFGAAPSSKHGQQQHDNGICICVNTAPARYLCLVPAAQSKPVWQQLSDACEQADHHYWQWLDIRDGIGEVRQATSGEFIPQMLNLQHLEGISFTKGCYTGQEIVARMQYRGTLKKAMYRIGGTGNAPAPNSIILQQGNDQPAGHVVIAEQVAEQQWEGLAVIPHSAVDAALHTAGQQPISLLPMPYTITVSEQKQ